MELPPDPVEEPAAEAVPAGQVFGWTVEISRNVVAWRKNRGISQERLAARAHISRETLRRIEMGGDTKLTTIERIALVLKLQPSMLTNDDPNRELPVPGPPYDQNGDRATPPYRPGKGKGDLKLAHSGQPERPSQLRLARVAVSPVEP